jgi:dCMP deaminase
MSNSAFFMKFALLGAENAKVNGTHVGCVLVQNGIIASIGMNGHAPGACDCQINELDRTERLPFAIHAEENALLNAANLGTSVKGAVAFVTHYPCAGCASKLKKSGIRTIYYLQNDEFEERWKTPNLELLLGFKEEGEFIREYGLYDSDTRS